MMILWSAYITTLHNTGNKFSRLSELQNSVGCFCRTGAAKSHHCIDLILFLMYLVTRAGEPA